MNVLRPDHGAHRFVERIDSAVAVANDDPPAPEPRSRRSPVALRFGTPEDAADVRVDKHHFFLTRYINAPSARRGCVLRDDGEFQSAPHLAIRFAQAIELLSFRADHDR